MSKQITLTLPDGKSVHHPVGTTGFQAAQAIGPKLAQAVVAMKLDGHFVKE